MRTVDGHPNSCSVPLSECRIYFAQIAGCGPIKVGATRARGIDKRLARIQTFIPYDVEFLCVASGGIYSERAVKHLCREYLIRGEWFTPNEILAEIIAHVSAHGTLPEFVVKTAKAMIAERKAMKRPKNKGARRGPYKMKDLHV